MTLPTTGSISLAQVRAEFGAPAGTPLHAFVRGGSWVPNIAQNNGVPTSTPVSLDDLRGATNQPPVSLAAISNLVLTRGAPIPRTRPPRHLPSTGSVTASASGGNGSYTYAWAYVSGDTAITDSGSGATRYFNAPDADAGSATWKCTASDGSTSASRTFTVTSP